jgi:hypothetical protein
MRKLILIYILLLLNICLIVKMIMYNEELIICISLITAFWLIFSMLKNKIVNLYFTKIDEIYYHYYILLLLNKWINNNFLKNINKIIYQYKNVDINYFLILIKSLLETVIIKPNLLRLLNNITEIYKYILNIQNINYKNLYLLLINKTVKNNQYILLYGILQQILKNKLINK